MNEPRVTSPTSETKQAAKRLVQHLEWSEGFWLGYVFTVDANQAGFLERQLARGLGRRGRALRLVRPTAPAELRLERILEQPEAGCTWVEAIREPRSRNAAWTEAWLQLILRANERRELLRGRLLGGLVLVMHPSLKPEVRAAGPDLWSVRSMVLELPSGTLAPSSPMPGREPAPERFVDAELLDMDLARSEPAPVDAVPSFQQARAKLELAERLRNLGRHQEAAAASEAALSIARELAEDSVLIPALEAQSADLARIGREEDALELLDEAVRRRRGRFGGDGDLLLADALHRLGALANNLGKYDQAEPTLREAVRYLRERITSARDDYFARVARSLLASTLNQIGVGLLARGKAREALVVFDEAVDIARVLVASDPVAFVAALAGFLGNLSSSLSAVGRYGEALEAIDQALAVSVEHDPQDLALLVYNRGLLLQRLGRPMEAAAATDEAVTILDRLVSSGEQALTPQLATALVGHVGCLHEIGMQKVARDAATRAVDLLRELVSQGRPFVPKLAEALNNLALVSSGEQARDAVSEAVELLRPLATEEQHALRAELAVFLSNLGSNLAALGERDAAMSAAREAVAIQRQLPRASPERLAGALTNLACRLAEQGANSEAVELSQESVGLFRPLTTNFPDGLSPHLAKALTNLGTQLAAVGEHERALLASTEAVEIQRLLADGPELAAALVNLGSNLTQVKRYEDALSVTREAVAIYRELADDRPGEYGRELGIALHNLATSLGGAESWEEMLETANEAVELRRPLAEAGGEKPQRQLVQSLTLAGSAYEQLGKRDSAVSTYREAASILEPIVAPDDPLLQVLAAAITPADPQS